MRVCPHCGHKNQYDVRFCMKCNGDMNNLESPEYLPPTEEEVKKQKDERERQEIADATESAATLGSIMGILAWIVLVAGVIGALCLGSVFHSAIWGIVSIFMVTVDVLPFFAFSTILDLLKKNVRQNEMVINWVQKQEQNDG